MKFYRVLTDLKSTCDQLIRQSSTEQFQYFAFASCKRFIWQRNIYVAYLKVPQNVGATLVVARFAVDRFAVAWSQCMVIPLQRMINPLQTIIIWDYSQTLG